MAKIREAAKCDVDFIQLREKDFPIRQLEDLAREAIAIVRDASRKTCLLINSRTDVAIATNADGVHLRSEDVSPVVVREVYQTTKPLVSVSCHTPSDVLRAEEGGADFVVFGPVYGKSAVQATGLDLLAQVCQRKIPVLALGGVTVQNAADCMRAGARGVAGIRLFQENSIEETVFRLRAWKTA